MTVEQDQARVLELAGRVFPADVAARWYERGSEPLLGGVPPREAVEQGRTDRVLEVLEVIQAGAHS